MGNKVQLMNGTMLRVRPSVRPSVCLCALYVKSADHSVQHSGCCWWSTESVAVIADNVIK